MVFSSCATNDNIFPPVGTNIVNPVVVLVDAAANRAYLVNSNNGVSYSSGSFHVLDITNPLVPTLKNSTVQLEFSGHAYHDAVNKYVYLANRYSASDQQTSDYILRVNVDEASANYLVQDTYGDGVNIWAMTHDAATDTLYTATSDGYLDYFTVANPANITAVPLFNFTLSNGGVLTASTYRDVAVVGSQAYLTRTGGGVLIMNIGNYQPTYFIYDIPNPQGLIYDGTYVYVVGISNDDSLSYLYAIDPAQFPLVTGGGTVPAVSITTAGVLVVPAIQVGADTAAGSQEVSFSDDYVFVSNMGDNTISVINRPALTKTIPDITVGTGPFGMGLYSPGGVDKYLYVTNYTSNNISIIDLTVSPPAVVGTYP